MLLSFFIKRKRALLYQYLAALQPYIDGVRQLDIVKFALPLKKISFHPIFSAVGKHCNFFEAFRAASRPYFTYASR